MPNNSEAETGGALIRAQNTGQITKPAVFEPNPDEGVYCRLKDTYGQEIEVKYSSSGDHEAVWIFCYDPQNPDGPSPHLNRKQAIKVRDALTEFIEEANPRGI